MFLASLQLIPRNPTIRTHNVVALKFQANQGRKNTFHTWPPPGQTKSQIMSNPPSQLQKAIYVVYTANWGIICHLPPLTGTKKTTIDSTPNPKFALETFAHFFFDTWSDRGLGKVGLSPLPWDACGKWRFRLGSPILKMFHNPGGDWHPGRGNNPKDKLKHLGVGLILSPPRQIL